MQHSGSENLWCGDFPRHVYIHWPFCAQRCTYCEFVALIGQAELMPGYGSMLKSEIKKFKHLVAQRDVRTIFWGGGTPSLCPLDIFSDVMSLFKSHDRDFVEATIETNPEDINSESLAAWKASGINRLSIGVQAFDDAILRRANRRHSADDAVEAVELAAGEF
ncbi:radical SAM protein, partial [bacterium]|nr:radical SAM protein [bacterium]